MANEQHFFEKKITLGNLIQIAVLVVAIVLAYGRMEANQEIIRGRVDQISKEVESARLQFVRADVHTLQIQVIQERLDEIQQDLKEIKKAVK